MYVLTCVNCTKKGSDIKSVKFTSYYVTSIDLMIVLNLEVCIKFKSVHVSGAHFG